MIAAKSCPAAGTSAISPISTSSDASASADSPCWCKPGDGPTEAAQQAELCLGDVEQASPRTQVVPLEMRTPELSVGSLLHGSGHCKPCYWFWRAQGCSNGSECRHCHMCVRAAPRALARQQMIEQQMAPCHKADAPELPVPQIVPLESRTPELSMGSAIHGTGHCKPCAWFWKPQGCTNGSECCHCHLCPDGEIKARKKASALAARKHHRRPLRAASQRVDDLQEKPHAQQRVVRRLKTCPC